MPISLKNRLLRFVGHRRWLKGRERILRLFAHPDTHRPMPFEVDFYGLRYSGTLSNFVDWNVLFYGAFGPEELELLGALAQALRARGKPVDAFDIGANIGHHTLFLSAHADRVFSFEPYEAVRTEMQRKLQHAGVSNVTVFPVALGDKTETAIFHPPTGANQGTGTLTAVLPENASADELRVEVVQGDDFFSSYHLPPIGLLKLDVEGFEANVLRGLRQTILRDRPPILMEMLPAEDEGATAHRIASVLDLLYPDHLLFSVKQKRGRLALGPFLQGQSGEALVLPVELAGIIPGTEAR